MTMDQQITADAWVELHYTLSNEDGTLIESSQGEAPLRYVHGHGQLIPGLEQALNGREVGDTFSLLVPPELAYGEVQDDLIQEVPLNAFESVETLAVGTQFHTEDDLGPVIVTVKSIEEETVFLDSNHPFAGKSLHFAIEVLSIRKATEAEIKALSVQQGA